MGKKAKKTTKAKKPAAAKSDKKADSGKVTKKQILAVCDLATIDEMRAALNKLAKKATGEKKKALAALAANGHIADAATMRGQIQVTA